MSTGLICKVQEGDTLESIADAHRILETDLLNVNSQLIEEGCGTAVEPQAGDTLNIPKKSKFNSNKSLQNGTGSCSQDCEEKLKKATVDKNGFIQGMGYTKDHCTKLEGKKLNKVKAIVLHRTVTKKYSKPTGSLGTHFYIGKKGTVYQTASLDKRTSHVGRGLYSKEKDETGKGKYSNTWPHKKRGQEEAKKSYPKRYPMSFESVGIEVVGNWTKTSGKVTKKESVKYEGQEKGKWEPITSAQRKSTVCLCKFLKQKYSLKNSDIYAHDDIKPKTFGEASSYIDQILKEL